MILSTLADLDKTRTELGECWKSSHWSGSTFIFHPGKRVFPQPIERLNSQAQPISEQSRRTRDRDRETETKELGVPWDRWNQIPHNGFHPPPRTWPCSIGTTLPFLSQHLCWDDGPGRILFLIYCSVFSCTAEITIVLWLAALLQAWCSRCENQGSANKGLHHCHW